MKDNISNLDFKRHRLGLTKELSVFNILNTYKKSSLKLKLEIISLIEVLRHTEQNYNEALGLIFKLEKVKDSNGLLTQLSKRELDSRVLSNVKQSLKLLLKGMPMKFLGMSIIFLALYW